jgi:hypothetical protein
LLEFEAEQAGRKGEEIWPPSYAEFVGKCSQNKGVAAHKQFTPSLPEPESAKAERKAKGRERLATIKGILDE